MSECPLDIEDLTPEWCTGALRESGVLSDDEHVAGVSSRPLGSALGFYSTMHHLELTIVGGARPPDTRPAVVKLAVDAPFNRELGFGLGYYEREFRFYDDLADRVPVQVPQFLGGAFDGDNRRCVMLLEDLSHGAIHEQYEALSVDQLRGTLSELARLHGAFAGASVLDDLPWIGPVSGSAVAIGMGVEVALDRYQPDAGGPDPLAPVMELALALRGRAEDLMGPLDRGMDTLVHTDCRSVNLVFEIQDDGCRPVFLDWQGTARGNGLLDVASIMVLGLSVADRRATEQELLEHYLSELDAAGVAVDRADAEEAYRRGATVQFLLSLAQLDLSAYDPTNQWGVWLERSMAAVTDHGLPPELAG